MKFTALAFIAFMIAGCKFHEVDPGKLYRGPQPSGSEVETMIKDFRIKTIINLRGEHVGEDWYDQEKAAADKYGVPMINIAMSASRLPHSGDLVKLLDAFRDAAKPLFVHCMAGVDRTGEASAIYQMLYMGKSRDEALEMLSPKFGHFENNKPAKRYFIRDVWVDETWARTEYNPCKGGYEYYDTEDSYCKDGKATPVPDDGDT